MATVVVLLLVVYLWPAQLGGSARIIVVAGDSMEPTYSFGDAVVVRDRDVTDVGDVVVFEVPEGRFPRVPDALEFSKLARERDLRIDPMGRRRLRAVTHLDVSADAIADALHRIRSLLA